VMHLRNWFLLRTMNGCTIMISLVFSNSSSVDSKGDDPVVRWCHKV